MQEQSVTTFGLATNREWMTKDGRKMQSSEFHELVCWGGLAEFASQYLKKGKLIYVEGHLKTRSWDDASGVKKFRTEIVAEDLIMLDRRPKDIQTPTRGTLEDTETSSDAETPSNKMQQTVTMEDPLAI